MTAKIVSKMTEIEKKREEKRTNKINSLKNEFEGGKIKKFSQVFAIFSPTPLSAELGIPYNTFMDKVDSPEHFKVGEILKFAKLLGVDDNIIYGFIKNAIQIGK